MMAVVALAALLVGCHSRDDARQTVDTTLPNEPNVTASDEHRALRSAVDAREATLEAGSLERYSRDRETIDDDGAQMADQAARTPPVEDTPAVGASGRVVRPTTDPAFWISTDDYPPAALRNDEQGTTRFTVSVDGTGRVAACEVTSSSGHPDLDDTTCRLIQRRARFIPATNENGDDIASTWSSSVRWSVPKD